MATTPGSSEPSTSAVLQPRDVQRELANSDSSIVYLEPSALDDAAVAALLEHDVPMHAERDYVRLKWAVRRATADEVGSHLAFRDAGSAANTPSGVPAPEGEESTEGVPVHDPALAETQPVGTTPTDSGASSPVEGVTTETGTVPEPA